MARTRSTAIASSKPLPDLPQAVIDSRLPESQREIVRENFAHNQGFASDDEYQMSRYREPKAETPRTPTANLGHVETGHVPGHLAKTR